MIIDLRYLRQVDALARHRNFARAARELNISQPALSRSIGVLENQLGLKLFDRNVREVTPTVFGKRMLELGRSMLVDARRLEKEMALLKGIEVGEITIGAGPLPSEIFLGNALGELINRHPNLKIQVLIERPLHLLGMLQNDKIDIMLADTRTITDRDLFEIINLPKWEARYVCRPGHPLAGKNQIVLRDIFAFPIATPWIPESVWAALSKLGGLTDSELSSFPGGVIECQYYKVLCESIKVCDAVGIGLEPIFRDSVQNEKLVYLPIRTPQITTQFGLVTKKGYSLPPAAEVFRQFVIKAAHESI